MKTNLRGLLATMFATGLLAACSSDGGTPPPVDSGVTTDMGGAMDVQTTVDVQAPTDTAGDRGTVDVQRVDAGNLVAMTCAAAVDLSTMTPGSDGTIRVMGDSTDAPAVQIGNLGLAAEGGCLGATAGGDGSKGATVVYRYTTRTAGILTASTANPGTGFDTVVAILSACTANATPLACNDDAPGVLTSTARTSVPLTAGQTVFIVVGGWGATPKGAVENESGPFVLTVRESAPIAIGMPCPLGQVCAAGSICVGATAMNSGVCTADGAGPGAACRTTAPFCDTTLNCSVTTPSMAARGICRRSVAVGEACGATAVCAGMAFCPNFASAPAPSDAGVAADAGAPMTARYCAAPVMETEPNNTQEMPQAAVTTTTVFRGALATGADVDCYAVTVPTGATLYAEVTDAMGTCDLNEGEDTVINVYRQGTATAIATNDDIASGVYCSGVAGPGTPALLRVAAGTYSVCVSSYLAMGMGTPIESYYLTVGVTPPAP